jgi:nitrate/TMAO reductase-like tetraheme cytochrome c subunit
MVSFSGAETGGFRRSRDEEVCESCHEMRVAKTEIMTKNVSKENNGRR